MISTTLLEKIKSNIHISYDGCWKWKLGKSHGYGIVWENRTRGFRVHRIMYENKNGPIIGGLEIDHLCGNRSCCNPDHLEAVTHQINCSRGNVGKLTAKLNRAKTHCPKGHRYYGPNLYVNPSNQRQCRTCMNERNRKIYRKNRLGAIA